MASIQTNALAGFRLCETGFLVLLDQLSAYDRRSAFTKGIFANNDPSGPFLPIVVAAPSGGRRGDSFLRDAGHFEERSGTQTEK